MKHKKLLNVLYIAYNKCTPATSYTLCKGLGRHKLAMSCAYSFSEMIFIDVIGISFFAFAGILVCLQLDSTQYLYIL